MFLNEEIKAAEALYENLADEKVADILDDDEIEAVSEKKSAYHNLQNRVILPKHNYKFSTIIFQRLQ